jgi:hypothetical protein
MDFTFPKPDDSDDFQNPNKTLETFCEEFNKTYHGHFYGNIVTSSDIISDNIFVINYSFWVAFLKINDYSYRFFEVIPEKSDGGFPVSINAFHGPMEEFGSAKNHEELNKLINKVLNSDRGRFIILSNY